MIALGLGVALMVGILLWAAITAGERGDQAVETVELRFGADVTVAMVEAALASIAGLPSGRLVLVDVVADADGIRHFLHADHATIEALRGQWRGVLPSLRLEAVATPAEPVWSEEASVRLSEEYGVLRTDATSEAAAALLGSLAPLGRGEVVRLRWQLAPVWGSTAASDESTSAWRAKVAGPVLDGCGEVSALAARPERAWQLVSQVGSVLRARRGGHGALVVSRILRRPGLMRRLREGGMSLPKRHWYSAAELAAVVGFPVGTPRVPGLTLGTAPLLMASRRIPSVGRVLAVSNWPGSDRRLAQPVRGALSHTLVAGPTGVGKSALIANLAVQDMRAGRGLLVLDAKGDLVDDVLARVPAGRADDVIVLDPGRVGPVPGLRLFERGGDPELIADAVVGVLSDLHADAWGPLSARWSRVGMVTLAHDPESSLADFPRLVTDDAFRRRLVARVEDPLLRGAWAGFEAMSQQERLHQTSAPVSKVEEIIGRRAVRAVLAQRHPAIDMREVLATGKVVLVSLSPAQVGSPAARLLGALIVFKFFGAVQARAGLPASKRRPFFAYIDEPALLGRLPVPLDRLLELARGLGCGLVLAAQSLAQLAPHVRSAVLSNAASVVAFRQSADDARLLARELEGVMAEELQRLEQFEAVVRIGLGPGDIAPPATGRTLPLPEATSDPEEVRRGSAERFGVLPSDVDAALAELHKQAATGVPVGRIRRSS